MVNLFHVKALTILGHLRKVGSRGEDITDSPQPSSFGLECFLQRRSLLEFEPEKTNLRVRDPMKLALKVFALFCFHSFAHLLRHLDADLSPRQLAGICNGLRQSPVLAPDHSFYERGQVARGTSFANDPLPHDDHRVLSVLERQLSNVGAAEVVRISRVHLPGHHVDPDLGAALQAEVFLVGLVEGRLPAGAKVHDVGEHDLGVGGHAAGRKQLLDFVFALSLHPLVDGPLCALGILTTVVGLVQI